MLMLILYIVLLILGIVFAIMYTGYWVAIVIGVLAASPIISFLFAIIAGVRCKVEILEDKKQVHRGEDITLRVRIKNKSIFPVMNGKLYYSCEYNVMPRKKRRYVKFSIKGKGEKILKFYVQAKYCGEVEMQIKQLRVKDFFGFLPFIKGVRASYKKTVLPKIELLEVNVDRGVYFYDGEYDEFYQDHPGDDPSEVYDIREYKEGDKLQRIHWKLSTKKDKLMVKEFSAPVVIDTVIICDNICTQKGTRRMEQFD